MLSKPGSDSVPFFQTKGVAWSKTDKYLRHEKSIFHFFVLQHLGLNMCHLELFRFFVRLLIFLQPEKSDPREAGGTALLLW